MPAWWMTPFVDTSPQLMRLEAQMGRILMALTDMTATLKKIDAATNNIAADLTALKLLIVPGMAQADVDTVQGLLDAAAAKLEGVAASTPDAPAA